MEFHVDGLYINIISVKT